MDLSQSCADCGMLGAQPKDGKYHVCSFCGWRGQPPVIEMPAEGYPYWAAECGKRQDLKNQGKLSFVRVFFEGRRREKVQPLLKDVVRYERLVVTPSYIFLELDRTIDLGELEKVRALPGVVDVTLH